MIRYDGIPERSGPLGVGGFIRDRRRRSGPANRTWRRRGSPRTTTRSTRRPTPSGSRSRKASRRSPTERSRAARRATDGRRGRGTQGAHGDLPRHRDGRRVRPQGLPEPRHPVLGRHRPRPVHRRDATNRRAVRDLSGGQNPRTSAWPATLGAGSRGDGLVRHHARDRAGLGLRVRRGPHRRRGRLDDASRPQRAHQPGHRLLCPFWPACIRSSPTTRPTTATGRARRQELGPGGRPAGRAAAARSGPRPVAVRRIATSRSRSATRATTSSRAGSLRRRHRRLHRGGHDLVRGRRRHLRRLDRARRARQTARPTRTTGSPAQPPTRRRPTGRVEARSRARARSSTSSRACSGRIRSRRRAGSSTTSTASGSRSRTRPARSTRRTSSASNVPGDSVVVHELAHQWYGDSLAVAAWQHIWLNEGFATYAEWLWSEREGLGTAQEIFDACTTGSPPTTRSGS